MGEIQGPIRLSLLRCFRPYSRWVNGRDNRSSHEHLELTSGTLLKNDRNVELQREGEKRWLCFRHSRVRILIGSTRTVATEARNLSLLTCDFSRLELAKNILFLVGA